jgi:hypothetical protein
MKTYKADYIKDNWAYALGSVLNVTAIVAGLYALAVLVFGIGR